jgi:hypothetical protein
VKIISLSVGKWRLAWKQKEFRIKALICLVAFVIISIITLPYFKYIELRTGYQLDDPILELIPARNFSLLIFILMYGIAFTNILFLLKDPSRFVKYAQIYSLVILARLTCIFLTPLEAPIGVIPLEDFFIYGKDVITKDLFFSGHISSLFLLYLIADKSILKYINLAATLLVAFLILLQHIHYTIDILAAPAIVWIIFSIVTKRQNASATVK